MNTEVKRILDAVSGSTDRNIFIYDESFLLKSLARRLTKNAIENMSVYLDFVTDNSAEGAEFFLSLHRQGYGSRNHATHLRAILYHQGSGQRHGSGTGDGIFNNQEPRRFRLVQ